MGFWLNSRRLGRPLATLALVTACSGGGDSRAPVAAPAVTVPSPAPAVPATPPAPVASPTPAMLVTPPAPTASPSPVEPTPEPAPTAAPGPVAPPPDKQTPRFAAACAVGDTVTISAVGDLLLHHELQIQAYAKPENFLAVWGGVQDLLALADISYANLEGTVAAGLDRTGAAVPDPGRKFDKKVYTSYPRFNYHPSLLDDLVKSGVDVVSTANNHSLDREPAGVDATIAALDKVGLAHTGTRARGTTTPFHAITRARGIAVAWLACTMHTNMIADPDAQVLRCYEPEGALEQLVRELVADPTIDAVIVTPHWGKEYTPRPEKPQKQLARRLAEAGATAVIGSHPHVLQPWEVVPGVDGHETLVMYSLGNFASHQPDLAKRSSMILFLGLTRPPGQKARVHGVRYVPLHVREEDQEFFVEAIDRVDGPANSRRLTVRMFGEAAVQDPDAPLATRPACP